MLTSQSKLYGYSEEPAGGVEKVYLRSNSHCSLGRFWAIAFLALAILLPTTRVAIAQTMGSGAIQGEVLDNSGALVSNATITAVDPSTGYTEKQHTTASGFYSLSALPPGRYTVTVSASGFKTVVRNNVDVNALAIVGLNLTLSIGNVQETVTVSSLPPQLDTTNGSLDITIPNSTYEELPLAMNDHPKGPLGFIDLLPGAAVGSYDTGLATYNFNGGPAFTSGLYINGMPVATGVLSGDSRNIYISTSTEDVDQFEAITSGVPAYYAGQGIANLVLKSGTNQFHGDVYENVRNTIFDAAGYFATSTPVEHQNEFGGSLGGPVVKNRLFFFGNFDDYRLMAGSNPVYFSLPTAAEQAGDFSALSVPIYDPDSTTCIGNVCTRQQFSYNGVLNVIPPDRLSSVSQSLQSYLPATINSSLQNNYLSADVGGLSQKMYFAKLDWTISPTNHFYNVFQHGAQSQLGLTSTPQGELPLPYSGPLARGGATTIMIEQVGDTEAFTPRFVNVFGYQFNNFGAAYNTFSQSGDYPSKAGLTGLPPGVSSTAFPPISFSGPNTQSNWAQSSGSLSSTAYTNIIQDNLQWAHGRHSLTIGTQLTYWQNAEGLFNSVSFAFSNNPTAGYNSSGTLLTTTGNSYATFLLGQVSSATGTVYSIPNIAGYNKNYAVYAQDDWKVAKKLTINAGLRYIIAKPYVSAGNKNSWLNPSIPNSEVGGYPGVLQFAGYGAGSCNCRTQVATHYLTFDPRIGFAYRVTDKTVIRGSYTISHFNIGALGGNNDPQGTGFTGYSTTLSDTSPNTTGKTTAFDWDSGLPTYQAPPFFEPTLGTGYNTTTGATGGAVNYNRPDTAGRQAYAENWNLTLEQQVTPATVMSLSYSASAGHFLAVPGGFGIYSNQINPKYLQLGSLLTSTATAANIAKAQSIFPEITLPYANYDGSIGQMLKPFPQYAIVGDIFADFGNSNYNALQVYMRHSMSSGLYFLASYTWSKEIDNTGSSAWFSYGATPRSAYNLQAERSNGISDIPQVITFAYVYKLPFGLGHRIGGSQGKVNALINGWQLSGLHHYRSGAPLGPFSASCLVSYSGSCYANYNPAFIGSARINGPYGSGNPKAGTPYININAFQEPASYTYGNTPRTLAYGLRGPWYLDEDISLVKDIQIRDGLTLKLKANAFNVFNRTVFGGISTAINSSAFGTISTQSNLPRELQFEAYLKF